MTSELIRPVVAELPPYNAGASMDAIRASFAAGAFAKLDSNENPLGCSETAKTAMLGAVNESARYPDPASPPLLSSLAARLGVATGQVLIGNGSEELIQILYQTVLRNGDRVVTVVPSFGLHELYATVMGASVTKVPATADWRFPVERILGEATAGGPARIVVLSSPSNPMGICLSQPELDALADGLSPETLLVLDEAYIEYLPAAMRNHALERLRSGGKPWMVLRTFSKAYGLAGLRIGYAATDDEELVQCMAKIRTPFNINAVAIAAATAALDDEVHLESCTRAANAQRERLALELEALGYPVVPSSANFVFADAGGPSVQFSDRAKSVGVFIKPWLEPGYETYFRVSAGLSSETDRFLAFAAAWKQRA